MFAVHLERFLKPFTDLLIGDLRVALLGLLGDDDGVDDLLFGLLLELRVAFTTRNLQPGLGFGFDAGESLLDQVRVDEFTVDADHAGRVARKLGGARVYWRGCPIRERGTSRFLSTGMPSMSLEGSGPEMKGAIQPPAAEMPLLRVPYRIRFESQWRRPSMGTRSCSIESRWRMVTVSVRLWSSPSPCPIVSKSMAMQKGVPTSS